jgi:hypothetical protein
MLLDHAEGYRGEFAMAKGLLFHMCCGQAHAFDVTRKAIEFWHADLDPLTHAPDLQEWVRKCSKVRDELVSLHQKTTRLAMTDATETFPKTGAAFLIAAEGALDVLAAVGHALQRAQQKGVAIDNMAEFDRALREVTQLRERFAAKYSGLDPASIAAEITAYFPAAGAKAAPPAADTVGDMDLPPSLAVSLEAKVAVLQRTS